MPRSSSSRARPATPGSSASSTTGPTSTPRRSPSSTRSRPHIQRHSEAQGLIRLSRQAQKDGKEKPPASDAGLIAGLVVGGVLVIGGAIVLLARRGKPRPAVMGRSRCGCQRRPAVQRSRPRRGNGDADVRARASRADAGADVRRSHAARRHAGRKTFAINDGGIAPTASLAQRRQRDLHRGRSPVALATHSDRFIVVAARRRGVLVNDHRALGKHVSIGIDNRPARRDRSEHDHGTYDDVARRRITRSPLRRIGDVRDRRRARLPEPAISSV